MTTEQHPQGSHSARESHSEHVVRDEQVVRRDDHVAPDEAGTTPRDESAARAEHRGANIALNDALFAGDPVRQERYASVVAQIAREADGRSEDEVERIVREGLGRTDIEISDVERSRLVEQIVRAQGITHVTSDSAGILEGHGNATDLRNDAGPDAPGLGRDGRSTGR